MSGHGAIVHPRAGHPGAEQGQTMLRSGPAFEAITLSANGSSCAKIGDTLT
jgi:hypothetical protein